MVESISSINSFLRWWAIGLSDVFPAPLSNLIFGPSAVLSLSLRGDRAILHLVYPGGEFQLFELPIEKDPKTKKKRVSRNRSLRQPSGVEVGETIVRLDQNSVLSTQIDLPALAALDLRSAVQADLDRFTPFNTDGIYFDAQIIGVDDAANRIKVVLQVAQISDVEEAVAIAKSAGLHATRVTGESSRSGLKLNILPASLRHRPRRVLQKVVKALAVSLVCAVAIHASLLYLQKQKIIQENKTLIRDLRATAIDAADKEDQLSELRAAVANLESEKSEHPSVMVVFAEVTEALMDHSFLLEFEMQANILKLSGFSSDPSDMLLRLEDNDRLRKARFTSPLTRDPRTGLNRFNVELELAGNRQ